MKKFLSAIISATMLFLLAGCGQAAESAVEKIRLGLIKGPSGLGAVGLMNNVKSNETINEYDIEIFGSTDEMKAKVVSGAVDIAALPTNLASAIYQKNNKDIKVLAVIALGNLFVLSNDETITSIADLNGKTVCMSGQAATPEYIVSGLLDKAGIKDKVTVEYQSEHTQVLALAAAGTAPIVILPEPFASTLTSKDTSFKSVIDLNAEWNVQNPSTPLMMGCLIVKKDFLEKHEQAVMDFMTEYKLSVNSVLEDMAAASVSAVEHKLIDNAEVARAALPNCGLSYIDGGAMSKQLPEFFKVLYGNNLAAIGGSLPDDRFYYVQ